jgi:hypothetical protein
MSVQIHACVMAFVMSRRLSNPLSSVVVVSIWHECPEADPTVATTVRSPNDKRPAPAPTFRIPRLCPRRAPRSRDRPSRYSWGTWVSVPQCNSCLAWIAQRLHGGPLVSVSPWASPSGEPRSAGRAGDIGHTRGVVATAGVLITAGALGQWLAPTLGVVVAAGSSWAPVRPPSSTAHYRGFSPQCPPRAAVASPDGSACRCGRAWPGARWRPSPPHTSPDCPRRGRPSPPSESSRR